MKKQTKIAIYARLSKEDEDDGAKKNSVSINHQITTCKNYLKDNNIKFENSNNELILKDTILNTKKIIVRYSNLDCNVCVDSIIRYSKLLAEKIGKDKIVILAKNTDKRDFHLFSRINKNELDIYQVNSKLTNLDDLGFPYMFIYKEDNTISHIFIPHKEYPKMFTWYFEIISKYLENNFNEQ